MSITTKKFKSMLDEVLKQNTGINQEQERILRDACLRLYAKLTAIDENARIAGEIRDDIKQRAIEFYEAGEK